MADIRQTPLLDDFERPDENPVQYPWVTPNSRPDHLMQISGGTLTGTAGFTAGQRARWEGDSWSGNVEVWGMACGTTGIGEGWRIGLTMVGTGYPGYIAGYEVLPHEGVHFGWYLRRLNGDGTYANLNWQAGFQPGGKLVLFRCNGTQIEGWVSTDPAGTDWTLVISATDNTFRGPFYLHLGTTGSQTGWCWFGGGLAAPTRTQIYRIIRA